MSTEVVDLLCNLCRKCSDMHEELYSKIPLAASEFYFFLHMPKRKKYDIQFVTREMNLSQSKISRTVVNLVNHGYACRETDKEDKRMLNLCLTEKGLAMWDHVQKYKCTCEDRISELMDDEKKAVFTEYLAILLKGL